VASDVELALDEKVRRMETIVSTGASETYRNFIDFRQMAAQIEMMCNHDHELSSSMQGNAALSSFMESFTHSNGHDHDDEHEIDPRTGKKRSKKKKRSWFGVYR
jgi:hypothetical protein